MTISDTMATKLVKIEGEIDEARLRADYTGAIPNLLKKWRKLMATPTTVLEDVIRAETCLYTVLNRSPSPVPWFCFYGYPPAIHPEYIHLAKPVLTSTEIALIHEAAESLSRAYTALLQSQQLAVQNNPAFGLPSCPGEEDRIKALFANSQLYLEIIVIKAQILMLRGLYAECLKVLQNEIDLPCFLASSTTCAVKKEGPAGTATTAAPTPNPPAQTVTQVKGIGIIYLAMAYTLKAECLYFDSLPSNRLAIDEEAIKGQVNFNPVTPFDTVDNQFPTPQLPPAFPEESAKLLHSLLAFFSDLAPVDVDMNPNLTVIANSATPLVENGNDLAAAQPVYPFALPIPEMVMKSSHWSLMVHHGLFWGSMVWLQAWFIQVNSPPITITSFPYNLAFPLLTYQTLAFIRAFFHTCTLHLPYSEKQHYSIKQGAPKHPQECILTASWAIRFLVVWTYVVVQKDQHAVTLPLVVDYLPMLDATGYYQACTLDQELEILFQLWFKAIAALHPFPKANVKDLPPAMVNMLMEELVATLEWSDLFLVMKPFSVKMIETTLKHTFHSLLCIRILAMSQFRIGETGSGLTLLQRYKEIAKEQFRSNQEPSTYEYLYYPRLELQFRSLFKQLKIAYLSMFLSHQDGIERCMNFMIDGSIKLAEASEFEKAIETIDFARGMIRPTKKVSPSLLSKLHDTHGAILCLMAQRCLDASKRDELRTQAKGAFLESLQAVPSASYHVYYQTALLAAEQHDLAEAKAQVKLALKQNKSHLPSWHLLALLLTASREYEKAIRLLELGIRESISHHLSNIPIDSKITTYDLVCTLARDQRLNEAWTPIVYEEFLTSMFEMKLTQSKILEVMKGSESALSIVHELFRWYKVLFEEEVQIQDFIRLRSESVGSVNSNWLVGPFSDHLHVRLQTRRKRTLLTKAFLANPLESEESVFDEKHRNLSSHSISSLAKTTQKSHVLARLWLRIAQILVATSHSNEAVRALVEMESNMKDSTYLASDMGYLNYLLARPEKAVGFWHKALAKDPWNVTALLGIAKYHFDMHQIEEASFILDDLTMTSGHGCIDAWYFLGRIHKEQGNIEMANTCFLKALELQKTEPTFPFAALPRLSQSFLSENPIGAA